MPMWLELSSSNQGNCRLGEYISTVIHVYKRTVSWIPVYEQYISIRTYGQTQAGAIGQPALGPPETRNWVVINIKMPLVHCGRCCC